MPDSRTSEEIDKQSLLSEETVEEGFGGRLPANTASSSRFGQFISSCKARPLVVSVTTIVTISFLLFTTLAARRKNSSDIYINHCGSTPDEALALGCKFDVLNYSWQPAECFDEEIYNKYWEKSQEHGPLKWYADSSFTKELPQDIELLMHTPFVWVEHRFHVMHCMYTWELMHHGLILNKPVAEWVSNFSHTMHCTHTVLEENWKVKDTSVKASHNTCLMLK